jgi:hypothetical protein
MALYGVFAASALAAGPIITVNGVKEQTLNTATFTGTIDPNGFGNTTYKVEYGRTKHYGRTTPNIHVSGSGAVPVEVLLTGLQPMSTYHFRVSATSFGGTTESADNEFEDLLSWKVEGKKLENLAEPATFSDLYAGKKGEGGQVEIDGVLSTGTVVRFYCKQSSHVTGILDVQYSNLTFNEECVTYVNFMPSKVCTPVGGITLHLDGHLAQSAPITVKMGNECSIAEEEMEFIGGGYSPPTVEESASFTSVLRGYTYRSDNGSQARWETSFRPQRNGLVGAWSLTGAFAGKPFGISEG